jgi:hypothetical protein
MSGRRVTACQGSRNDLSTSATVAEVAQEPGVAEQTAYHRLKLADCRRIRRPFGLLLRQAGLRRRQWLIWYEAFGIICQQASNRCSRHLFWMVKHPERFVFHDSAVLRPPTGRLNMPTRAPSRGERCGIPSGASTRRLVENARERLPGFPTQLPLALFTAIVGCASEPGDLVLDPFSGSGTTGDAALGLGRRYLGFERSSCFAEQSRLRLQALSQDLIGERESSQEILA